MSKCYSSIKSVSLRNLKCFLRSAVIIFMVEDICQFLPIDINPTLYGNCIIVKYSAVSDGASNGSNFGAFVDPCRVDN